MTEAIRDGNHVTVALGVSSASDTTTLPFKIDSATGRLLTTAAAGSGDVVGPASSTDNAVARFDSTTGKLLQNSVVTIGDTGAIEGALSLNLSGLTASEIVITDGSKNLASAAVATYPSLTELSYVKGLTSAVQTQLGTKMANPMTTGGDIIYGGASGVPTRLANGTAGQVLQSNGTTVAPSWVAAGAGDMVLASVQSVTGLKTFDTTKLAVKGSSTGSTAIASANASATDYTQTLPARDGTVANLDNVTFIGTTSVALNRTSAALTLAGITLTTPDIGTPSAGTLTNCTGLPVAGLVALTASEMVITTAGGVLVSAAVATYPSLTELSYVKGVTSAIQTQIGTLLLKSGGTMTGDITLGENTSIALDPAGSADGKYSGITVTGTGGATIAFGEVVYLLAADSEWYLADADAAATADRMLGIAVSTSTDGNPITVLLQGIIRADAKFPTLTIGSAAYVGETPGAIQVAIPTGADNVIRRVGYALTADEIYFNPSMDSQITVA